MADVADAVVAITDDVKQTETSNSEVKVGEAAISKTDSEDVKTDAEPVKAVDAEETKEEAVDLKKDTASKSPGQKRKDGPFPVSADDRNQRKRFTNGGPRYNSNIVSRFDDQPESNEADEIRRQVEFYFSDSNLPIDAYLLGLTGGNQNKPVELKVIHNFKRMRHFQPFSAVRDAVKESDFLDLNGDDEITRKVPLNAKFSADAMHNRTLVHTNSMPRSIYVKGFGDETKSTHLDIEAFFNPYGPIKSVRLRRTNDGEFKGSVFVEFEDEEGQQRFLELDPKPQWQGDKDLEIMSKQAYVDLKHRGIMDGIVKPRSPRDFGGKPYRGNDRRFDDRDRHGSKGYYGDRDRNRDRDRRGGKDRFDKDDWKARRERDQRSDRRGGHRGGKRDGGYRKGDRGGGRGRRDSPDGGDRKRRRSPSRSDDEDSRDGRDRLTPEPKRRRSEGAVGGGEDDRIAVEPMTVKTDEDARENGGDASAAADEAAVKVDSNGAGAKNKKRALDEGEGQGDAKKVKGDDDGDA